MCTGTDLYYEQMPYSPADGAGWLSPYKGGGQERFVVDRSLRDILGTNEDTIFIPLVLPKYTNIAASSDDMPVVLSSVT